MSGRKVNLRTASPAIQQAPKYEGFYFNAVSNIQRLAKDFEELDLTDMSDLGTCPRISGVRLQQIFHGGVTPEMFNDVWGRKGLKIWMILFVYDVVHRVTEGSEKSISEMMLRSYETYKKYCAEKLEIERPFATTNIKGEQDICPVVAVLTNNQDGYMVNEFCRNEKLNSFPLILAIDNGNSTRQHIGEVTVDGMREFLDRVPSSGHRVY